MSEKKQEPGKPAKKSDLNGMVLGLMFWAGMMAWVAWHIAPQPYWNHVFDTNLWQRFETLIGVR